MTYHYQLHTADSIKFLAELAVEKKLEVGNQATEPLKGPIYQSGSHEAGKHHCHNIKPLTRTTDGNCQSNVGTERSNHDEKRKAQSIRNRFPDVVQGNL